MGRAVDGNPAQAVGAGQHADCEEHQQDRHIETTRKFAGKNTEQQHDCHHRQKLMNRHFEKNFLLQ